jgi:hypothetical protein
MLLSKSGNNPDAVFPKVITPTVHGIIDYCHAAFFFTVGVLCTRSHNKAAARAAFATRASPSAVGGLAGGGRRAAAISGSPADALTVSLAGNP